MALVSSLSFSAIIGQSSERNVSISSTRDSALNVENFRIRTSSPCYSAGIWATNPVSRMVTRCLSASSDKVAPTVAETKLNFLKAYKRPVPSIYNTVLQELIVQHHLMKYKRTYRYDPVFALGFVTVYDQLMDGYPSDEDREAIFQAYIKALREEPEQYRTDAEKLEEWARSQTSSSLMEFSSKDGEIEGIMKDVAERSGNGSFSYTRFFAIGLFRVLELANVSDPTLLERLCAALNINKINVDRDLDVYRNLLSKLVQAKELLREYVDREKKKVEERSNSKANEAATKCLGDYQYISQ